MPGRPRKPKELKVIQGTFRKTREPKARPDFSGKVPNPPMWLNAAARREWRRVVKEFAKLDMLKGIDFAELAAYCGAFADMAQLSKDIEKEGVVSPTINGGVQRNPKTTLLKEAREFIHKSCQQFGMTPSSRSRVDLSPPAGAKVDELDAILNDTGT
jgi:P27 family predicted phage terminase small subunit